MDEERAFFDERPETRMHLLTCPHCSVAGEYRLQWLVRRKRQQAPRNADERTLAKFRKAQSYMVRREDAVDCVNQRCRKHFEITGLQTVADLVDTSVLPADHKEAAGPAPAADRAALLRARFARKTYN
jgi:hypothetical protein